jgi:hypothetical protein
LAEKEKAERLADVMENLAKKQEKIKERFKFHI